MESFLIFGEVFRVLEAFRVIALAILQNTKNLHSEYGSSPARKLMT